MIKLKEYVVVKYNSSFIYFIFRSKIKVTNTNDILNITKNIIKGTTKEFLETTYNSSTINQLLNILDKNGLLYHNDYKSIDKREERLLFYFDQYNGDGYKKILKLSKANVCIVGMGGIGGNILHILASTGVMNFILFDYDKVEFSNLNRQFFYNVNDIGKFKVEVCKEKLSHFNPLINCKIYNEAIDSSGRLNNILQEQNVDIIICAADSPVNIKDILQSTAIQLKSAFCCGGLGIDYGYYKLVTKVNINNKLDGELDENEIYLNRKAPIGSFGGTNSIISSFMSFDIINYLIGENTWSNNKKIVFDFKDMCMLSAEY